MIIIVHRVNTTEQLKQTPADYGVEIDIRAYGNKLILTHEPYEDAETLENYLEHFIHRFIVFNIKEAGIEQRVISLAKQYNIPPTNYFLLDVEFPYLYKASRKLGVKEIAVRYSEAEPIDMSLAQKNFVNWIWIDVNTTLPLDTAVIKKFAGFKTCLVSPECWGRPEDITPYRKKMEHLDFTPNAVMTDFEYIDKWK